MVKQVEFNTKNENPFYGMSNTLRLYQEGSKGNVTTSMLEAAWKECKDENQLSVLISILFSIGDITARQHNIFDGKVESGGNAMRESFRDVIIPFLVKKTNSSKKLKLMNLITEYTVMDNILAARIVTKKKTSIPIKTINMVEIFGEDVVAQYCYDIITKGTTFQKICLAKFLSRPRFSKRPGKTKMLSETKEVMKTKSSLLVKISDKCKFTYEDKGTYIDFVGFYKWRKQFNANSEAVLFSSGKIKDLDAEEFIKFIDMLPSDARFRVRNRVMFGQNSDGSFKWIKQKGWFSDWEKFKEQKQTEQRVLETKVTEGIADEADIAKLKEVKKKAKVNIGAVNFAGMFGEIVNGTIDKVKIQPFLDKINLPYNNLVFIDDSGSMNSRYGAHPFNARQFGAFMATICLMKNPDNDAKNIIGLFSDRCRMFNGITSVRISVNSLLVQQTKSIARKPLIDTNNHFLDNLRSMESWLQSASTWNGTNISSVLETLHKWAVDSPGNIEELRKYPIWTFISDGNFNNKASVEASVSDFMRKSENYLGFKPFILLIDVGSRTSADITRFEGIDNLMMVPPNPASIEMLLTNFRDMDIYDVYTPLLSMYRSKRYAPIRDFVFNTKKKKSTKEVEV